MTVSEKIAYIKGMMEGMNFDSSAPENKLLSAVIDALGELSKKVDMIEEDTDMLKDYADELDHDLGDLESDFYEIDDDDECGCGCEHDDDLDDLDFDFADDCCCDDSDDSFVEIECPKCGAKMVVDDSLDPSDIVCPSCLEHFNADAQ